ncbi:hypothetical protein L195_g063895, partial [Trifolium pratense]
MDNLQLHSGNPPCIDVAFDYDLLTDTSKNINLQNDRVIKRGGGGVVDEEDEVG